MTAQRFPHLERGMLAAVERQRAAVLPSRLAELEAQVARLTDLLARARARARLAELDSVAPPPAGGEASSLPLSNTLERGPGGEVEVTFDGRPVVTQAEAARRLGVKPYKITRWRDQGRLEHVVVNGRVMIFADALHLMR